MSYSLRKKPLGREARRVARRELELILREVLTVTNGDSSGAVQEACKHFKKIRALLQLLRPRLGDALYKRESAALRKAVHRMSPIRDAHARLLTIDKVIARGGRRSVPA